MWSRLEQRVARPAQYVGTASWRPTTATASRYPASRSAVTGRPAARRARAKPRRRASGPFLGSAGAVRVVVTVIASRPEHLVEAGADAVGVLAVLDGHAQRCGRQLDVEVGGAEGVEGAGPVERLGDTRWLDQVVALPQPLDEADHLLGEGGGDVGRTAADDGQLALQARMVDPVVEAAALEGVMELPRPVRGEDHDRRVGGAHGADLGDGHLVGREDLEEERLELVVGPVDLVDEQDGGRLPQGPEHRPRQQEPLVEQRLLELTHVLRGATGTGLDRAQMEDLTGEVPVVEGLARVDPLVALQPDERQVQRLGDGL